MLSIQKTPNYWRSNVLARVSFLQEDRANEPKQLAIDKDSVNENKHHDEVVKRIQAVRRSYFLERRLFL